MKLTLELGSALAELPLRCICREYPNKLDHVINDAGDLRSPRELHPAFYGCFDWHSSVHGHWMLVNLLKYFDLPKSEQIRSMLRETMSTANLAAEAAYLDQPNRQSFERTYGWAWLLKLAHELHDWDDPDGKAWAHNLKPLEQKFVRRYIDFLPKQTYPIRTGLHSNTAFGLAFAFDYATAVRDDALSDLISNCALNYFAADSQFSAASEPSGADFLSPVLVEADLMRRVLPSDEFEAWFSGFLPDPHPLLTPVQLTDRSDPQLAHLDGLNLSRSWCMRSVAAALTPGSEVRALLLESAEAHAQAGLASVQSGDYAGEHWLASFAVYMLQVQLRR